MIRILTIALILSQLALFTQVFFLSKANEQITELKDRCKTLQWKTDSLGSEIFVLQTGITRYEISLEMLEDEDPKSASEFYKRLSQTE